MNVKSIKTDLLYVINQHLILLDALKRIQENLADPTESDADFYARDPGNAQASDDHMNKPLTDAERIARAYDDLDKVTH